MLRRLFVILLSFISISIITSTFEASSDGYDIIGFPFVFYKQLGGKCFDCADKNFFKIHYLIIDFIFTASIVFGIFSMYKKKAKIMNYLSKIFNQRTALIFPTVLLAALQSYFSHITTSCYGHEIFSIYFFIEAFIFLLLFFTRLESKLSILIYFSVFLFECIYFVPAEKPISPNVFLMLIIGIIRIYSCVGLLKVVRNKK